MFPYILYSLTQQNLTTAYQICQREKYSKAETREKSVKVVYVIQGTGRLTSCCDADWLATALVRFQFETFKSVQEMGAFLMKDIESPKPDSLYKVVQI